MGVCNRININHITIPPLSKGSNTLSILILHYFGKKKKVIVALGLIIFVHGSCQFFRPLVPRPYWMQDKSLFRGSYKLNPSQHYCYTKSYPRPLAEILPHLPCLLLDQSIDHVV